MDDGIHDVAPTGPSEVEAFNHGKHAAAHIGPYSHVIKFIYRLAYM